MQRTRVPVTSVAIVAMVAMVLAIVPAPPARGQDGALQQRDRVEMSDGVPLEVKLGGLAHDGALPPRPTIIEFTPYAPGDCPLRYGDAYNYLCVHVRGTGASSGAFDKLGPAAQRDVVDTLRWACDQPWSDGRLGLSGFSASAIVLYNSLHLELPCVRTAVLGSGTYELYRDLLYPGGMPNMVPALGVLGLISAPMVPAGEQRLREDPLSLLPAVTGLLTTVTNFLLHPTLDTYWRERGFRGDVNDLPILMTDGFFDVESRGAFQAFQQLRDDGAHLRVFGAHDGIPPGVDLHREEQRWFDQHLLGVDTGILDEPRVQLLLADGDRVAMLTDDAFVEVDADDWPVPGTRWRTLHLDAGRSGTAASRNDGSLTLEPGAPSTTVGTTISSLGTATDPHTTSILGVFDQAPGLLDMRLADLGGLTWTSDPLLEDVLLAGPGSFEVSLRSTSPETDLFVVVSDVWPDGSAHAVATGRLRTSFPHIDPERSLIDEHGTIVQPYNDFSAKDPAGLLEERRYHVELWPIGNRFREGHRLRLHLVGASTYHLPTLPAVNQVRLGEGGSQLHLPVLPGSDLDAALGGAAPDDGAPDDDGTDDGGVDDGDGVVDGSDGDGGSDGGSDDGSDDGDGTDGSAGDDTNDGTDDGGTDDGGTQAPFPAPVRGTENACPTDRVPANRFPDVAGGSAIAHAIDCIAWWGVTLGDDRGNYDQAGRVTRDQMASFIARAISGSDGDLPAGSSAFRDVTSGPHAANIDALAGARVIGGYPDGTYRPSDEVTRGQMARFLVGAYEYRTSTSVPPPSRQWFRDVPAGYALAESVDQARDAGFAAGRTETEYAPNESVTRAQMALFIARYLDRLVSEGTATLPG